MQPLILFILWSAIFWGYDTTWFPNNSNSFNKWRSLLPILAAAIALIILSYQSFSLFSPLGLMLGYVLLGMVGAFSSTRSLYISHWWAILFASPLLVLAIVDPQHISLIMNLNWVIACLLSLGLTLYFFTRPDVRITFRSLFVTSLRPFEHWVGHETNMFGLVGSRPTGLARYSAIASLVVLCLYVTGHWWAVFGFLVFTGILLFSKGKTEMISFLISMGFILFSTHNLLSPIMLIYLLVIAVSYIILFGNITAKEFPMAEAPKKQPKQIETTKMVEVVKVIEDIPIPSDKAIAKKAQVWRFTTLGGRMGGIWQKAISVIKEHPILGQGFNIERYRLKDYKGDPGSVDSTLINALLQSGLLGTALFLIAICWTIFMGYQLFLSGNNSLLFLEASSVGIFLLLRGITQSFSGYSADWLFLAPIIAYLQIISLSH